MDISLTEFCAVSLNEAIEKLYDVFGRYEVSHPLTGSPYTISEEDIETVLSKPLRDLSHADLYVFAFSAISTFGDLEDFKHFLPRIFELAATEKDFAIDRQIAVGGKLEYAEWLAWPKAEVDTIEQFQRAMWLDILSHYPSTIPADECLCSVATSKTKLEPYLDVWLSASDCLENASLQLGSFVCTHVACLESRELLGAFWEQLPGMARRVSEWMVSREGAPRAEQALLAFSRTPEGADIGDVLHEYKRACEA